MRLGIFGEDGAGTCETEYQMARALRRSKEGQAEVITLLSHVAEKSPHKTTRIRARKMKAELMIGSGDANSAVAVLRKCLLELEVSDVATQQPVLRECLLELEARNNRQIYHC